MFISRIPLGLAEVAVLLLLAGAVVVLGSGGGEPRPVMAAVHAEQAPMQIAEQAPVQVRGTRVQVTASEPADSVHTPVAAADDEESWATASWYGAGFAGRTTASGEPFDPRELTAAHRDLPFGTWLEVSNPKNGKKVQVRINDRGPFVPGRELDLSAAAFAYLAHPAEGVIRVRVRFIDTFQPLHYNQERDERESGLKSLLD